MMAGAAAPGDRLDVAHRAQLAQDLKRFLERPTAPWTAPATPTAPPGPPIGEPALDYLRSLEPDCTADGR